MAVKRNSRFHLRIVLSWFENGGKRKPLDWYWESTHFKPEFSELIINEILTCDTTLCFKIGDKLEFDNFQDKERELQKKRHLCDKDFGNSLKEIRKLVAVMNTYVESVGATNITQNIHQTNIQSRLRNQIRLIVGDVLIQNGGFDSSEHWAFGNYWKVENSRVYVDGSQNGDAHLSIPVTVLNNKKYILLFDLQIDGGALDVSLGGDRKWGLSKSDKISLTFQIKSSPTTLRFIGNSEFRGSLDNIRLSVE